MNNRILKRSISRKRSQQLCARQCKRIACEIRDNLRSSANVGNDVRRYDAVTKIQDTLIPVYAECGSSTANFENDACDNTYVVSTNDNLFSESDVASSSLNISLVEPTFRESLASCFVQNNLTHVQCNNILSVLRTHSCFSDLPKNVRTLIQTPRDKVFISTVEPGEYIHFGLEEGIVEVLLQFPITSLPSELEIDFNTDGCNLDKSGNIHIWPIQCKLANIRHTKPIIIGIYRGDTKPSDPNTFFEKFIVDIKTISNNGGISVHGKRLPISLRCFIADAPARAFILNHRGHMSNKPCSKCRVSGTWYEGRNIFRGVNHLLRTDTEYVTCNDEDHHKDGRSPLATLPFGMVSQVPFEYMHLVCLGVVKKLLSALVCGKYSRRSKLPARSISIMSKRLETLKEYCPSDFARRPKSLDTCTKYKATEFRQFLLYTGPVVTYGILDQQLYTHFLFLHVAIRILVSASPSEAYLKFADLALKKFVDRCESLYGATFNSYNVHCLIHLTDDVRRLGPLDSFSAFPYENNMTFFRKYCRKPNLPLQQIYNRMAEVKACNTSQHFSTSSSVHVSMKYNSGQIPPNLSANSLQYRKIMFSEMLFSLETRDNCCILHDRSVCIVTNILVADNSYHLIMRKFLKVNDFYDVGILSSAVDIFICSSLSNDIFSVSLDQVRTKCYRMPFWNRSIIVDESSGDEDDYLQSFQYIVAAMIHYDTF